MMETSQKLPGFTDLLAETWATYKRGWKSLLKLLSLSYLFVILVIGLGFLISLSLVWLQSLVVGSNFYLYIIPVVLVGLLVFTYLQTLVQIGFILTIKKVDEGQPVHIIRLLTENKDKVFPLWVIAVLSGLIVLGAFWLFIIPALILGIWFSLGSFIYVYEGNRGMDALLKSREYMKGRSLKVISYHIFFQILMYAVIFIPTYIFKSLNLESLTSVYSLLLQVVTVPLAVVFSYTIYKHLRLVNPNVSDTFPQSRKNKYLLLLAVTPVVLGIFAVWLLKAAPKAIEEFNSNTEEEYPADTDYQTDTIDDSVSMSLTPKANLIQYSYFNI